MNYIPLILIVEDEPSLAQVLREYLEASGYRVAWLSRGDQVIDQVQAEQPALILLDIMLPGIDGLTVFKELRRHCDVPVVLATAKVDEIDRLIGLELGADDYLCKPYSPREMVVRVKNILRRSGAERPSTTTALSLDRAKFTASYNGQSMDLTPVEFRLLWFLSENPGRVYSRQQLLDNLYTDYRTVSERTVDSHIKNLRRKIQNMNTTQELIYSVYGVGYKFEADD